MIVQFIVTADTKQRSVTAGVTADGLLVFERPAADVITALRGIADTCEKVLARLAKNDAPKE